MDNKLLFHEENLELSRTISSTLEKLQSNLTKNHINHLYNDFYTIYENAIIFKATQIENIIKKIVHLLQLIKNDLIKLTHNFLNLFEKMVQLLERLDNQFLYNEILNEKDTLLYNQICQSLEKIFQNSTPFEQKVLHFTHMDLNKKTILFVDDSIMIRKICEKLALLEGYNVQMGHDGLDGLRLARAHQFDLIFSDVNMPKMDGFEFLEEIRKLPQYDFTPIVMLTTERAPELVSYAKSLGVKSWLTKPFTLEKLAKTFEKLI